MPRKKGRMTFTSATPRFCRTIASLSRKLAEMEASSALTFTSASLCFNSSRTVALAFGIYIHLVVALQQVSDNCIADSRASKHAKINAQVLPSSICWRLHLPRHASKIARTITSFPSEFTKRQFCCRIGECHSRWVWLHFAIGHESHQYHPVWPGLTWPDLTWLIDPTFIQSVKGCHHHFVYSVQQSPCVRDARKRCGCIRSERYNVQQLQSFHCYASLEMAFNPKTSYIFRRFDLCVLVSWIYPYPTLF